MKRTLARAGFNGVLGLHDFSHAQHKARLYIQQILIYVVERVVELVVCCQPLEWKHGASSEQ